MFQRLEREGLAPAPEADKETLINRVSLTLTGLPPKLDEVDAFVNDASPDAYERLVDRLLASPAYAEHMTDYWLDLARFSESDGFLDDHHDRVLWPWRDWVIEAFRSDMPYDRFGTEQLAGDLLPNASKEQVLATTYLRVGKRTTENGAIDAEYKAEYMTERTDNALGVAFMGLTVGCARCHDHKYDPIKQRDYYALGAFFNSNDEPGAYAPGFSGIQGGPTLPWPDCAGSGEAHGVDRRRRRARGGLRYGARCRRRRGRRGGAEARIGRPRRGREIVARIARFRARCVLRVRLGAPRDPHGLAAAASCADSACDADRIPAQSVRRCAAYGRTKPPSSAGSASRRRCSRACRATTTPSRSRCRLPTRAALRRP